MVGLLGRDCIAFNIPPETTTGRNYFRDGTLMVRRGLALLLALAAAGCGLSPADAPEAKPSSPTGPLYQPANCGQITGRVHWRGDIPLVEPFTILPNPGGVGILREKQQKANPNAPQIDPDQRGVRDAVVFLRG